LKNDAEEWAEDYIVGHVRSNQATPFSWNGIWFYSRDNRLAPWFKATFPTPKLEAVEVIGETACYITLAGETWKTAKQDDYWSFFPTWDAAHSSLMDLARKKVRVARHLLELAKATLGNIKGMKPPTQ
jgi:hypothetical protein